jgi:disulfide bond formation protein DsbB
VSALILILLVIAGAVLLTGLLLFALILMAIFLLIIAGLYVYVRLKLWWHRRHPPKILEGQDDYL